MMNKLPAWLPPLPEGAVYLGKGGEFLVQKPFAGWSTGCIPWSMQPKLWGCRTDLYYAAPADSEIARLNGLNENKPSWHDAPDWAEWLAQDSNGCWWWYDKKPEPAGSMFLDFNGGEGAQIAKGECEPNPDWLQTLERRPWSEKGGNIEPLPLRMPPELIDMDMIKKLVGIGYRLEIDRHGLRGYKDEN